MAKFISDVQGAEALSKQVAAKLSMGKPKMDNRFKKQKETKAKEAKDRKPAETKPEPSKKTSPKASSKPSPEAMPSAKKDKKLPGGAIKRGGPVPFPRKWTQPGLPGVKAEKVKVEKTKAPTSASSNLPKSRQLPLPGIKEIKETKR